MQRHQITRVRHELKRRSLTVSALELLTPKMLRIGLTSPDLHDFTSASADDHIKLFFPTSEGGSVMRDFTPRSFNAAQGELTIDFALHDAGPATQWAAAARIGDRLEIGGPKGSTVIPSDFDWYLLVGDETAFPAMARRVEELAPATPVFTYAIVGAPDELLDFTSPADLTQVWQVRDGQGDAAQLRAALEDFVPPPGDGFVWIAAEGLVARSLRQYMIETRGHPREWIKAAGYWLHGRADGGGKIED